MFSIEGECDNKTFVVSVNGRVERFPVFIDDGDEMVSFERDSQLKSILSECGIDPDSVEFFYRYAGVAKGEPDPVDVILSELIAKDPVLSFKIDAKKLVDQLADMAITRLKEDDSADETCLKTRIRWTLASVYADIDRVGLGDISKN